MGRGAKIALAIVGVAVVALVIVVVVMIEHVDDGTHAPSKRVTPDRVERFDTIVVLPRDASAFTVSDIEERINRLDAVDEYAEVPRDTLAYLLTSDEAPDAEGWVDTVCGDPATRGYVVALAEPAADSRRALADVLGDDATVHPSTIEPPQTEIFMRVSATEAQTDAVRTKLEADPDVAKVRFISHADAYEEFRRLFADQPDLIRSEPADGSGLPESFRVEFRDGVSPDAVIRRYRLPGINSINRPTETEGVPTAPPLNPCSRG